MSAFLVDPEKIAALGRAYANIYSDRGQLRYGGAEVIACKIANILARQNIASVEHRYPDLVGKSAREFLGYASNEIYVRHCEFMVANDASYEADEGTCGHYDYQACETPGYAESPVAEIINLIRAQVTA